jgi:DNA-binding NtrC family response regulator
MESDGMRIDRSNAALGTVLVVDDDPAVRELARMMLEEEGFRVLTSDCAQSGLGAFKRTSGAADMMSVDAAVPGPIDGSQISDMANVSWPEMTVLVTSGQVRAEPREFRPRSQFAEKPWRADDVVRAVRLLARQARGGDRPGSTR